MDGGGFLEIGQKNKRTSDWLENRFSTMRHQSYRPTTKSIHGVIAWHALETWPVSASGQSVAPFSVTRITHRTGATRVRIFMLLTSHSGIAGIGLAEVPTTVPSVAQHSGGTQAASSSFRSGLTRDACIIAKSLDFKSIEYNVYYGVHVQTSNGM